MDPEGHRYETLVQLQWLMSDVPSPTRSVVCIVQALLKRCTR